MDKRLFTKVIKQQMLSYGFEKTGTFDYAKVTQDGITKIVVRAPNMMYGFFVSAQFNDFGEYSGIYSKSKIRFSSEKDNKYLDLLLCSASARDYSENEIISAVNILMESLNMYLQNGRAAIRENFDKWYVVHTKETNEILEYLELPTIDPYSDAYMLEQVDSYKYGAFAMGTLDEYYAHKEFYDKYTNHGCVVSIDEKHNRFQISYKPAKKR